MRIWSLKRGGASACQVDGQGSLQTEAHLSHHLCFPGISDITLNFGILSSPQASIFFPLGYYHLGQGMHSILRAAMEFT